MIIIEIKVEGISLSDLIEQLKLLKEEIVEIQGDHRVTRVRVLGSNFKSKLGYEKSY